MKQNWMFTIELIPWTIVSTRMAHLLDADAEERAVIESAIAAGNVDKTEGRM